MKKNIPESAKNILMPEGDNNAKIFDEMFKTLKSYLYGEADCDKEKIKSRIDIFYTAFCDQISSYLVNEKWW